MPFTKIGPNQYRSPSGRVLTKRQVQAYYAKETAKKPPRRPLKGQA